MLANLTLGTVVISATVLTHTVGLIVLTQMMRTLHHGLRLHSHDVGKTISMVTTVLGLFLVHTVEIWIWALVYIGVGGFSDLEHALYFSTATFSTVGCGDMVLPSAWRLLGALEGVNGFLLIGWSTAYLVAASTRLGPFRPGEHF
jgi:Ion channel